MIGINVLAQSVSDRAALVVWLHGARPGVVVVMDDPALARSIKGDLPDALIIHRTYNENDKRWHEVVFPQAWLAAHAGTGGDGVVLQVFNEPEIDDLSVFLDWIEDLILLCPAHITLALPAFAVGNPNEQLIADGAFDRLIRAISGSRHLLMLHEYFAPDPSSDYPYLCGRFTFWMARAKTLGIAPPRIVLGEFGHDIGGAEDDGWRGVGYSEERYAELLIEAHRNIYAPYGIPCAVFCYGKGAGESGKERWRSFDVEGANTILQRLTDYNQSAQTEPPSDPHAVRTTMVLNLRPTSGTAQPPITTMPKGALFTAYMQPVIPAADYEWVHADYGVLKGFVVTEVGGVKTFEFAPLIDGMVKWTNVPTVNVRAQALVSAPIVGTLSAGDAVRYDPLLVEGGSYSVNGVTMRAWYRLETGYVAAGVARIEAVVDDAPIVTVPDVPYVSQLGVGANRLNNDCKEAVVATGIFWSLLRCGHPVMRGLTVDMLTRGRTDAPTSVTDVVDLLHDFGVAATYTPSLTLDAMRAELDAGRPCIALVNYLYIGGERFGHYVVIIGYGERGVWLHDPYRRGASWYVTNEALERALTDVAPFASIPYQGVVLV